MKHTPFSTQIDLNYHLAKMALHSGAVFVAYCISWLVFAPIQAQLIPEVFTLISLFYLPFGIKMISAFFEGYRSIVYLAPGVFLSFLLYVDMSFSNPKTYVTLLISYGVGPTVFGLLDWLKADGTHRLTASQAWRTLVLGGAISSVIISFSIHAVWAETIDAEVVFASMARFIVGDLLGLILVFTVLITLFRFRRLQSCGSRNQTKA